MARESYHEKKAGQEAKKDGWRHRKLATGGGDPDHMFFKEGHTVLIEFKQPGKYPTPLQYDTMDEWRDDGFPTTWAGRWQDAIDFLQEHDPS